MVIILIFSLFRLQDQLKGLKFNPIQSNPSTPALSDWEEELRSKRRQIKKKKEELGRIEDDG